MGQRRAAVFAWVALVGLASVACNSVLGIEGGKLGAGGGGAGGSTTCPPIMAPDECEDGHVDTDAACCAEGRSCQGGMCVDGACTPLRVGFPSGETLDVLVIGERVYWSTGWGQQILSVKLDGTDQQELFPMLGENDGYVTQMATDGAFIYFTDYDGARIRSVPVGGGAITVISTVEEDLAPPQAEFGRIEYAGEYVYWGMFTTGGLFRAATDGSTPVAELVSPDFALGVAVDATHVYWSDISGARVRRLAIADIGTGDPEDVLTDATDPGELRLDGDRIYVGTGDSVRSALKDGTDADVILHATAQSYPWGIAVDDRFIYWSLHDGVEVRRTRKDGQGLVSVLDDAHTLPSGLAQDCNTLYFGTQEGVFKLTK